MASLRLLGNYWTKVFRILREGGEVNVRKQFWAICDFGISYFSDHYLISTSCGIWQVLFRNGGIPEKN